MKEATAELIPAAPQALAVATTNEPGLMTILQQAVERGADVGVIERLVALKERVDKNEAEKAFYDSKARLHAKLPQIHESGAIEINGKLQSRYARYEDIDAVLRPLLEAEGFSLEFDAKADGERLLMTGTLAHRQGHRETKTLPLSVDATGNKNKTQAIGSTMSYGRRYLCAMLLNIVTRGDDDDGNGGGNQFITREQADEIERLVATGGHNMQRFKAWLHVNEIAEIRQAGYQRAIDELKRKAAK